MATILVVDDEQGNRELLEAILEQAGLAVRLAANGPEALAAVGEAPPDLVLLDLMMPGMSGLDVCKHLKGNVATAAIPVIVVTALADLRAKETALALGADDFVTKPFQAADVLARVTAMLRIRHIAHDLDRTLAYLFELDVTRQAARREHVATTGPDGPLTPTPRKVLFVDDDALVRQFYGELLAEHGLQVTLAADGQEALARAAETTFDVVILDIVMPGMSGLEVLARLREADPDRPVLMLTGYVTAQNAIAALKLGAFDFLVKGLDPALVVLAIHRALRYRRERQFRTAQPSLPGA